MGKAEGRVKKDEKKNEGGRGEGEKNWRKTMKGWEERQERTKEREARIEESVSAEREAGTNLEGLG